jgi:hypothetical protein
MRRRIDGVSFNDLLKDCDCSLANAVKILKFLIQDQDSASVRVCDAIEYKGRLWLVPQWLEFPTERVTRPARIICVSKLHCQKMKPGNRYEADYVLNDPVPKSFFDGQIPPQLKGKVAVVERPDITIRAGGGLH